MGRWYWLWVISSLAVAAFHEPWRGEAQAWLVARTATSPAELLHRAALEASGPLYYLLLWPWAKAFPGAFPAAAFWISWAGAALAVAVLLFSGALPRTAALLAAFGYLLGYEYATQARLYGWGCFLLVTGMVADLRDRPRPAALVLGLASLVQLNFLFAATGWVAYRLLTGASPRRYLWTALGAALAVAHLSTALGDMPWQGWTVPPSPASRLGTTLVAPFLQSPGQLGLVGIPLFLLALAPLSPRARLAFLAGVVPFAALFLFRYNGFARSRHGGALFLLWLFLLPVAGGWYRLWVRRTVYGFLGVSLAAGLVARGLEIGFPYGDGAAAAERIGEVARAEGREPRLLVIDDIYGLVTAARLNTGLWTADAAMGCPFFPGKCPDTMVRHRDPWSRVDVARMCPREVLCFFVGHPDMGDPFPVTGGRWEPVFSTGGSLSEEDLVVYRLSRR